MRNKREEMLADLRPILDVPNDLRNGCLSLQALLGIFVVNKGVPSLDM